MNAQALEQATKVIDETIVLDATVFRLSRSP